MTTVSFFENTPWTSFDIDDLGQAALVPTMLTIEEQFYYVWLMRDWAKGKGAVVDLGAFLGGSTACLAEGVRQAGHRVQVHGYDRFEIPDLTGFWKRYAAHLARPPASEAKFTPREMPEFPAGDVEPLAAFFLEPWADSVVLHKGFIEDMSWDAAPIEVLVMDASKTAETMEAMSATFFPHLIPGRSIVVQQDFLWWRQPWIAAQMDLLQDYLEPVAYVRKESVSFLCTQTVPPEALDAARISRLPDKELIAALERMAARMTEFGVAKQVQRLCASVKANPQARKAFQFRNRP